VVVCLQDNNLLWAQPIYITQHKYSSSLLNSWDEKLTIDEKNSIILSTMVGAGSKNDANQFSGVLMGSVATVINNETVPQHGLYGYGEGALSFAFKEDGTAFIGKSGGGRLVFDGKGGYLASANWLSNSRDNTNDAGIIDADGKLGRSGPAGMAIGLKEGWIDARTFKLTAKDTSGNDTLILNSNPGENEYYLKVGNADGSNGFLSFS
jgi:hypothetical protein